MNIFDGCQRCGVSRLEHKPNGEATYNAFGRNPDVPCYFFEDEKANTRVEVRELYTHESPGPLKSVVLTEPS